MAVLLDFSKPLRDMAKGLLPRQIIDQQDSGSSPEVRPGDGQEVVLTRLVTGCKWLWRWHPYGIPDLDLDVGPANRDDLLAELHADGWLVLLVEPLLGESLYEGGLPDAYQGQLGSQP